MILGDPGAAAAMVEETVGRTGCRAVVGAGWGGLSRARPNTLFVLDAAPHDWLFPRVAAVVHHGGAGTTAARAARGQAVGGHPFIADQFFWGWRLRMRRGAPAVRQEKLTRTTSCAGGAGAARPGHAGRKRSVRRLIRQETASPRRPRGRTRRLAIRGLLRPAV